jgi:hypothetical protein
MKRLWLVMTLFSAAVTVSLTVSSQAGTTPSIMGTWEGRFSSHNFASFPVTLVINQGFGGKLTGAVNLVSPCLRNADLEITTQGSKVVLAGSDADGDTITLKGTVDDRGTELTMTYVLHGSGSGGCETDEGAGTLNKH